jgi:ATP-binding cassette, subfamily B, bacterial PglK
MIINLWNHLSKRRHRQFLLLLILMILSSLSEVISIGLVIPFLGVLTSPDLIFNHPLAQPLINSMGILEPKKLILPITFIFIFSAIFACLIRLFLLYVLTKFTWASGADLSVNIYRRSLYQDYLIHLDRNSSEVINGIIVKTNTVINGIIRPILILISSSILVIILFVGLLIVNIEAMLISICGCGFLYWLIIRFTRQRIKKNSESIANQSTLMIKALQEGLGGIRDVIIDGTQEFYCQIYRKSDLPFRQASGENQFIAGSPRYLMEAVGMIVISLLAYTMVNDNKILAVIPTLGAIALGAQRLLPALQQSYASFTQIKASYASFVDVMDLLNQPESVTSKKSNINPIDFGKNLEVKNLSFRYSGTSKWVLKDINLKIRKGETIGFIGETGSGKSTLIDLIMGLLKPEIGSIIVDSKLVDENNKRTWQNHIAHVPQNIFLTDGTVEENIAFGVPQNLINYKLVRKSAHYAQISNLFEEGNKTLVGERGLRLSGGQRQRIGIARALYKCKEILILDEATSSLDELTEKAVMSAISSKQIQLTTLIIAHRLTTLKNCDKIFKLEKGRIISEQSYEELMIENNKSIS